MYSTAEDVISYTGIQPADLGITSSQDGKSEEQQLTELIENWLEEVTDLINRDRNRDFEQEGYIPPGIHSIAKRMASNMVMIAIQRRSSPIVRLEDFSVSMVEEDIWGKNLRKELALYPKKPSYIFTRVRTTDEEYDS